MERQIVETTLYSLSVSPPSAPVQRRRDDRLMTLYRVGSMSIGERRELCLIKNICAGGMMVRAYCSLSEGTRLAIELKCGQPISGTVTWARDLHVGVSFDEPIDVIDILSSSMEGLRPRMPRIQIDSSVTLREGASLFRVRLCDISQGGLKLRCEAAFAENSQVVVMLPGIAPQPAVVRWNDADHLGITFNKMLALPVLVEWLRARRDAFIPAELPTAQSA